ncbi:hypothetical protein EON82_25675 [bacterium]|nr:MAG: hypothetical protein EON82_25675 [bacterium]
MTLSNIAMVGLFASLGVMAAMMPISVWLERRESRAMDRERAKRDEADRLRQIDRGRAWDKRKREFDTWLASHG